MQSKVCILVACVVGVSTVFSGCRSSKISANYDALVVHGDGNIVPFSRRGLSVVEQRAALISPTHVATKKQFELIWDQAGLGWVGVDSPVSGKLQLEFKLYNCLLSIINHQSDRTRLIKDLRSKINVIAEGCSDDQVPVLTEVFEFVGVIERAIGAGGLHCEANLERLKAYIQLKRDNTDCAYRLRWNHGERRFSQA